MKTIMISNNPKSAEQIMNGKKKIEVREFYIEPPFKVVNYVTQGDKNNIFWQSKLYRYIDDRSHNLYDYPLNGKVAFEYVVNDIEKFTTDCVYPELIAIAEKACLSQKEILNYSKGKTLYAWHISDLKIYDKPKELNNFKKPDCEKAEMHGCACLNRKCEYYRASNDYDYPPDCAYEQDITRPPQNFVYCEVRNDT